ncbi:hypothetical protein OHA91_39720 (plasmid) [Streptomyces erythrochromogenes]|uniref:Uncharacterized protein n=1 Tax=Streptomyces erythrochromogenes TaxID=285574 RepID=A0ABZ1QPE2_9ACTN|nr:hypothetical protein [Streptomyces erythrochromogenes]
MPAKPASVVPTSPVEPAVTELARFTGAHAIVFTAFIASASVLVVLGTPVQDILLLLGGVAGIAVLATSKPRPGAMLRRVFSAAITPSK